MNRYDLLRSRKSAVGSDGAVCNRVIERRLPVAIAKAVTLLLPLMAWGGSATAAIKNDGGFGRSSGVGWVVVSKTESRATYMYPSTIHRQENLAHMWSLIDYRSRQKSPASPLFFMSEKSENEYHCETAQWRTLSSSSHTHQMGNGQTVFSKPESAVWQPVTPGSDPEILWKFACRKITPKGTAR